MSRTENYRRHHQELRGLLGEINSLLIAGKITDNLEAVSSVVRRLFGKFGTHLAIEDRALYPQAIASSDATLSALAKQFQTEMGSISEQFKDYRKKWPGPRAISADPEQFVKDTKDVIKAFNYRLDREEKELYELFDKAA